MGVSDENRWWADEDLRERFFDWDRESGWYRRFFDIDDLAAIRVEDPEVFDVVHGKVLELVAEGVLDGLRVDHPDGLADPAGYLRRLRERGRRARLGREDPDADPPTRASARLAGRGHGRLRVPQRRHGALRRPGLRGRDDRAVRRPHGRGLGVPGGRTRRAGRAGDDDLRARGRPPARPPRRPRRRRRAVRAAGLPHLRRAVERPGRARGPRGDRGRRDGRAAGPRAAPRGARPRRVRRPLPADLAAGDGQGRRGHRASTATCGSSRSTRSAATRRASGCPSRPSTPPTRSARCARRAGCS